MSDRAARNAQYSYKANSNLVLQAERDRRTGDEPTGEAETLWGKLGNTRMGDRAQVTTRDKDLEEKLAKMKQQNKKKRQAADETAGRKKHRLADGGHILAVDQGASGYKPKTKETRIAYEHLLNFVQSYLGDQPQDIIRGAAEEILAILKNDNMRAPDKKKDVEQLLATMTEARFTDLSDIGRSITDFTEETTETGNEETLDDEIGVAVVFDEDEEEDDNFEIREEEDEDAEEGVTTEETRSLETIDHMEGDISDAMNVDDPYNVDPREIKAFWLKGQVSKQVDPDPIASQKLSEEILDILENSPDQSQCENRLVELLQYEKFDFIKLLLRNRLKIVWCTKLAHAEDDAQRQDIEQQMSRDPNTAQILDSLQRGGAKKAFDAAVRKDKGVAKRADREADRAGGKILDLEAISFQSGGHLMTNKQTNLPPGSFRKSQKGYEEFHIPALKQPPFEDNEELVKIADLPAWSQKAFEGMKTLNRIQSRLYKTAFTSAENLLLCAPTGAGKTNVAMLCMLHELGLHLDSQGQPDLESFKIVYIAPMKALVQECVLNFSKRLAAYNVSVKELTGDVNLTKQQIKETQIIVTTPEKWDIVTRKSGDRTFTQLVKLIIIDEIHLLHDDRGPVLESIIARTIRQIEATQEMVRLVGLSATLPNYEDVATLLRVKPDVGLFAFNNSYRPVPLEQQYIGITEKKALKRFQVMNEIVYEKVVERAGANQILIFVHSRKETAKTAKAIRDMALSKDTLSKFLREGSASREILQTEADESVKNADLKELLPYGFGIHHAGLARADRTLVEDLFADGHIQILVSTATLAWGVNLPAHTVIIKGTQIYNPEKGRWTELSPMDVMQMLGRAGRPQYDSTGEGIIITTQTEIHFYLSLLNQQLPIESQFVSKLVDNLNAEVVLGSVQNVDEAVQWLGYTYLYICMLRNPTLYGITFDEAESDKLLEQRRRDLIHTAASLLDKANLIKYDKKTGNFQATDLGVVSSHYYVSYASMTIYNEHLKPTLGDIELFRLFSLSNEFKYITVREEEKIELDHLLEKVPIPVKENMEEPSAKSNVLLQSYISRLKLEGLALVSDMVYITQSAARLMRALFEIVLKRGWAQLAERILNVCKMIDKRMWSTQSPLRQFGDIPEDIVKKLERKDFPLERLADLNAQEIGELINFPTMGKSVHKHILQFPRLDLTAHVQPVTRSILRVELTITPDFQYDEKYHGAAEPFWILVEDVDGEKVIHSEYFILKKKFADQEHVVTFTVPLFEPLHPQYFIRVISDRWVGAEATLPVSFRHLILPEKFPPHTELLDLQPLPISELKNPQYEALYNFKSFNPIQTQVFNSLHNGDHNVLVAAPTGSGKTVCAELALFRLWQQKPSGSKCVYIAPLPAIAKERLRDWQAKFEPLGKTVVELTGETVQDLKLMDRADVTIATPEQFDLLSRRWKQRKQVQNVNLLIVDELHLVGGEGGPTLEVVVSRMRYVASQTSNKVRIVALSVPIANAKDIGEWIGTTASTCFNFHPNSRPIPLEIHMQGFDMANFAARFMAMTRPTLYAVAHHGQGKPTLVFVPNRKSARQVAKDLISFYDPEDKNKNFLKVAKSDIASHLEHVGNKALREALSHGVAFYHDGLTDKERKIVEALFQAGAISVVVSTYNLCWGMSMSAHLVVIMGTQFYDGKEHRYADYPIADILQMMGRACRPKEDAAGKCVLLCFGPKKEFYKKFLYEPLPVESHLNHFLADHMNAEIVTKTIENKQDAVDYLTWTFLYRRLTLNPNYYNLQGASHRHLSDYLSELVEQTLADLQQSKCLSIEDEMDVSPLNLGIIACYYNVRYTTIELFDSSLNAKTKLKGLLEILASASEFESVPVRHGEEAILRKLAAHLPLKIEKQNYTTANTKVNVLLQAHFSRRALSADLAADQSFILENAVRLLQAMVDVISSSGWLSPALAAMELSQMITQALWDKDSSLKQLPHFNDELIQRCKAKNVETVFDLMDLEDADRSQLLRGLSERSVQDVARACNRYPNIDLAHELESAEVSTSENVAINVTLQREIEEDEEVGPVYAPLFPAKKIEGWWLVVGDTKSNVLHYIKRIALQKSSKVKLSFSAPPAGTHNLVLYFMCDSYSGCDQEYEIALKVNEAPAKMEE
eukprot:TRINITY_DN197_c0_g1_i3.p1 TRINITY_DN197_c0_g1~~TRINITY_DN197_c0_g1_i3.p1  ORF type:complete len:2134 (+),score=829.11 TRINITY_DN197_c0_g1_i3:506-6907(+)